MRPHHATTLVSEGGQTGSCTEYLSTEVLESFKIHFLIGRRSIRVERFQIPDRNESCKPFLKMKPLLESACSRFQNDCPHHRPTEKEKESEKKQSPDADREETTSYLAYYTPYPVVVVSVLASLACLLAGCILVKITGCKLMTQALW